MREMQIEGPVMLTAPVPVSGMLYITLVGVDGSIWTWELHKWVCKEPAKKPKRGGWAWVKRGIFMGPLLLMACNSPTEVEPVAAKQAICVHDEHTPKGCCLVDGDLDCPDIKPPRME